MIVSRRVYKIKPGHMREAVELWKQVCEEIDAMAAFSWRIYTCRVGPADTISIEAEWESLAEHERVVDDYLARPDVPAIQEQWEGIVESGTNEIWNLAEQKCC